MLNHIHEILLIIGDIYAVIKLWREVKKDRDLKKKNKQQ